MVTVALVGVRLKVTVEELPPPPLFLASPTPLQPASRTAAMPIAARSLTCRITRASDPIRFAFRLARTSKGVGSGILFVTNAFPVLLDTFTMASLSLYESFSIDDWAATRDARASCSGRSLERPSCMDEPKSIQIAPVRPRADFHY